MIEGVATGLIVFVITSLITYAIVKRDEIRRYLTPRRTQEGLAPLQWFKMLADDLGYWHKKLGEEVFVLRLLPYELSPKLMECLGMDIDYEDTISPYKRSIVDIIKGGGVEDIDYWDLSIIGRCNNQPVDRVTSNALCSMYFPVEPDEMDPDLKHETAVNTSELALIDDPIRKGIFLIGRLPKGHKEDNPIAYFRSDTNTKVKWKVGFSCDFNVSKDNFVERWRPKECMRSTSQEKMKELVGLWIEQWDQFGQSTADIAKAEVGKSIAINVDGVTSEQVKKCREFIRKWFGFNSSGKA